MPALPVVNPLLLVLQADGPKVFRLNAGHTDDGRPIVMPAVPAEIAPAGAGGECVFHRLHLVVTHSMAAPVPVRVIPILDGVRKDAEAVLLVLSPAPDGRLVSAPFKVDLGENIVGFDGISVVGRAALRGTWFSFRQDTPSGLADGDIQFDSAELEYEVVREGKDAAQ